MTFPGYTYFGWVRRVDSTLEQAETSALMYTLVLSVAGDVQAFAAGGTCRFFLCEVRNSLRSSLLEVIIVLCWCVFFRYDSPQHIMEEFFTLRMDFYHRRKASLMRKMESEWSKLDNKVGLLFFTYELAVSLGGNTAGPFIKMSLP